MKSRLRLELEEYLKENNYPMHMPGHKRRLMPEDDLPYAWDLTEVSGTDDLHHACGILKEAMDRTASLCHAARTWYLVNGSTAGNLAGAYALTHQNGEVLMDRSCHRSLFHIAQLRNLHVHWLKPFSVPGFQINGGITSEQVEENLKKYPHTEAVIVTSPTYEGVVSDIRGIAEICHRYNVPLFVDEAHGAHFGLSPYFPYNGMQCGADVCVQSFHKTLPSLTQTAVLHMRKGLVDERKIEQALDIFETSSPSYPLMVSLDACTEYLLKHGNECFEQWHHNILDFEKTIRNLKHLKVFCHQGDSPVSHGIYAYDPGKILIHSDVMNGGSLQNLLLNQYHFEMEMSMGNNVLAMSGPGDDPQMLIRFGETLKQIDSDLPETMEENRRPDIPDTVPESCMTISDALESDSHIVDLRSSIGQISHEYVYCYPPGIPVLIPGERISEELITWIEETCESGNPVHFSDSPDDSETIHVCV